ncbi:aspartate ammonia-lyase [Streptomyces sp. NPDC003023]|uniref:aspartate ammonia-lyase n=1 Tax=Streptomyces sp. NPDC003023 TaxID=3364675 RepID=UPI0036AF172A
MTDSTFRSEHDLLGERKVPSTAYYGVHTLRAMENFPITGTPISAHADLITALACVKQAAATANRNLGVIDEVRADAIIAACEEIRCGKLHEQFVVDVIQGGAGTSTNMNANEVIANRALEHLGHRRGEYQHLHPLDHVNAGQSTNDAYPTAVKVALYLAARRLEGAMVHLRLAFEAKAHEFSGVIKLGRTQLQDAVPMTLGQEFATYAVMLREDEQRLLEACGLICEINLGGTAIGTGINAHPGYAPLACGHLAAITGIPLVLAFDLIEATQDVGAFVQLSGVLKRIAVKLSKTCNDLRLLSSGPYTGLAEITLPPVQAGSSIMPAKVNPVIPEVVNQIAFGVIGNDLTVTLAAQAGQLQLNPFEPVIAYSLFQSLAQLRAGCLVLAERCITGITAHEERLRAGVERSLGIVTALTPYIGHAHAVEAAQQAMATHRPVAEIVVEQGLLTRAEIAGIVRPEALTGCPRPGDPAWSAEEAEGQA